MDRTLDSTVLHMVRTRLARDYPAQINVCLDLLSDDDIWWRPNDQAEFSARGGLTKAQVREKGRIGGRIGPRRVEPCR